MRRAPNNLFDLARAVDRKHYGMDAAAQKRAHLLSEARAVAKELARSNGTTNADQVGRVLAARGIRVSEIGPAMGKLFAGAEWVWTGERVKSSLMSNHAREIKVWRLA